VNFGPVTLELTGLIVNLRYDTAKFAYPAEYLTIYWTDFYIFSPNESILGADDQSRHLFPISQGTLPLQNILGEILKMTFIWQVVVQKQMG